METIHSQITRTNREGIEITKTVYYENNNKFGKSSFRTKYVCRKDGLFSRSHYTMRDAIKELKKNLDRKNKK